MPELPKSSGRNIVGFAPGPAPAGGAKPEAATPRPSRGAVTPKAGPEASGAAAPLAFNIAAEICLHLGNGKLLLAGWIFNPNAIVLRLSVLIPGKTSPITPKISWYARPEIASGLALDPSAPCGFVGVVDTGAPHSPERCRLQLDDGHRATRVDVTVVDVAQDHPRLIESLRSSLSVEGRLIALEAMLATDVLAQQPPLQQAQLLALWNATVAECPSAASGWAEFHIETAQQLAPYGVLLAGWLNCRQTMLESVDFVRVGEPGQCISSAWVRHERSDIVRMLRERGDFAETDEVGFLAAIETHGPSDRRCYLMLTRSDGLAQRVRVDERASPSDAIAVVMLLLGSFTSTGRHSMELLDKQIGPAIGKIWQSRPAPRADIVELRFGQGPERPEVSMVVPIYGRYDFVEHQIAQFCNDPAMRRSELIYVIDDPLIYDQGRQSCDDIYRLYDFPFRVLYQGCNQGFAAATNLGARYARADKLLLMNSDVFPRHLGWLPMLVDALEKLPEAGAVAPKLLFEDGSIQHAGIRFARNPGWGGMWINEHPGQGHPDAPASLEPVECAAVTAACLLIDTALYAELGGLCEDFIIGDFEDSDLCLRLRRMRRRNWLIPRVTLYHLERQSQAVAGNPEWRRNLTLYNGWLHHQRWDETISRIEAEAGPRGATGPVRCAS
jgi:O-antigen biosynthesis protein